MSDWAELLTEQRNDKSVRIDEVSTLEMLRIINNEDVIVAAAVSEVLGSVAETVEAAAKALTSGGRLFYVGAGSSGRLGVLDAAECPPTFSTNPDMVQAIIAGGQQAVFAAIEGSEDSAESGANALCNRQVSSLDCVVGIAASGVTPFVHGALKEARNRAATTVLLTCSAPTLGAADILIAPRVGPEVITGSTRMKAGTATKMILNMISTGAMVCLGKTMGNLMVDLQPNNAKLRDRSVRILQELTDLTRQGAAHVLNDAHGDLKVAIVKELAQVDVAKAKALISENGGRIKMAINRNEKCGGT